MLVRATQVLKEITEDVNTALVERITPKISDEHGAVTVLSFASGDKIAYREPPEHFKQEGST